MTQYTTLHIERLDAVAIVTLCRPDRLNALNATLKDELAAAFDALADDDQVGAVVLTGAGRGFCAGADIKERVGEKLTGGPFFFAQKRTEDLFSRLESFAQPLIAAVHGPALGGGCELAMICDLRLAGTSATFGLPETGLGMIPLAGGTQRLPRLIGVARAKEMMFTGDRIDAEQAHAIGLVNRIVPDDQLVEEAVTLAGRIAARAPLATRLLKAAVNAGMQTDLASALKFELLCGSILNDSHDRHEGMQAFIEKRAPVFKGR